MTIEKKDDSAKKTEKQPVVKLITIFDSTKKKDVKSAHAIGCKN